MWYLIKILRCSKSLKTASLLRQSKSKIKNYLKNGKIASNKK
nr:MAG TPA: hypothetical protein [Caudoviricetes sp.]